MLYSGNRLVAMPDMAKVKYRKVVSIMLATHKTPGRQAAVTFHKATSSPGCQATVAQKMGKALHHAGALRVYLVELLMTV